MTALVDFLARRIRATGPLTVAEFMTEALQPKPTDKMEHPIWNKVSHVVLFKYEPVPNPDPTQFVILGDNVIETLASAEAAFITGQVLAVDGGLVMM